MLKLNTDHLTKLEQEMHMKLSKASASSAKLRITEAANMCNTSPSKVSKFVRKLGFQTFKQYKLYFSGQKVDVQEKKTSTELERLMEFLKNFDPEVVDGFLSIIKRYNKIIIYGLGPSFISAEYFGYKLATVTDKNITVTQHEDYAERLANEGTLLLVFSVTGKFVSFDTLFQRTKATGADSMLILEEYDNKRHFLADYIFHLSKFKQSDDLRSFEKTRTVFFIFIEEVIAKLRQ
ncbi:hypothetical protein GCM10008983_07580 [Lentibacillus halophilus]|uniref:HTH rpiR-type domain-containing protein n=1 Tax=Lentibacillus halophilus TaxID=295065 RepID=A0ABP3IYP5_9BACI